MTKSKGNQCACGCGEWTKTKKGKWVGGHDGMLFSAICDAVGGVEGIRVIVEKHLGRPIILPPAKEPSEMIGPGMLGPLVPTKEGSFLDRSTSLGSVIG